MVLMLQKNFDRVGVLNKKLTDRWWWRWFRVFSRYNGNFVESGPSDQSRRGRRDGRHAAVARCLILTVRGCCSEIGDDLGDVFDRRACRVRGPGRGFDGGSVRFRFSGGRFWFDRRRGGFGRSLRFDFLRGRDGCRRWGRGRYCRFVRGARRFHDGFGSGERGCDGAVMLRAGTHGRHCGVRLTGRGHRLRSRLV